MIFTVTHVYFPGRRDGQGVTMETASIQLERLEQQLAEVQDLARQYAQVVRRHFGNRLRRIRLFGSAARGDWTPDSDIDVLVLLDRTDQEDSEWLVNRAVSMGLLDSGRLLQPIFMAEADFSHLLSRERRFALDVEKEGIEL